MKFVKIFIAHLHNGNYVKKQMKKKSVSLEKQIYSSKE